MPRPALSWGAPKGLFTDGGSSQVSRALVSQLPRQYGCPGRQGEGLQENVAFGLGLELPLWPHPGDSLYIRWHPDNLESLNGFSTSCSRLCLCPTFWLTTPVFLPRNQHSACHVADPTPGAWSYRSPSAETGVRDLGWEEGQVQSSGWPWSRSAPPIAEGQPCMLCLPEQGQTQGEV